MRAWGERLRRLIVAQLTQGVSPERIALTLALGLMFGLFPILGSTTLLCTVAAWLLRLNQPVMQLVNVLLSPLHLALLYPCYRAGETLFGQPHVPLLNLVEVSGRFAADPLQFVIDYGMIAVYGIVVWALVMPLAALLLYLLLRPVLEGLARGVRDVGAA